MNADRTSVDGTAGGEPVAGEPAVVVLRHNKIDLALHLLRPAPLDPDRPGRPLLLLHGLGDRSPSAVPPWAAGWPGPIAALDFTGHGRSTVPVGGGYTCEVLMADADLALAHLLDAGGPDAPCDSVTVLGRGLGAYVALQLAGGRADRVHGAILLDGPGLFGGPTGPSSPGFFHLPGDGTPPDPYALIELGRDLRPGDYAMSFVSLALGRAEPADPITVCAANRPTWLAAVADSPGVVVGPLDEALARYA